MNKENKNRILTELPIKGRCINWKETVGMELELLYYDETYKVKVVKYKNSRLWIDYNGYIYDEGINVTRFGNGSFGRVLKLHTKEFKYEIMDQFKDVRRDLTIIDKEYRKGENGRNYKWYKYTCHNCGWTEGWIKESDLKKGSGCACCTNQALVPHINSIKAKAPWMIELGVSEEDALTHMPQSNQKIEVTCPDCGKKKELAPSTIYSSKTIFCTCKNGKSYPEKFVASILTQLNIEFKTEYSPEYIKPKRSDFYLPTYNLIIEADGGLGHKGGIVHRRSDKTLEELVSIDNWKDEQHLLHGIETIRINCFKSNVEYIKNSIINSKLNELFDLDSIDWLNCEKYALSNIVKEVCDYWNNKEEWETIIDIGIKFRLKPATIMDYLKRGSGLKWCNICEIKSKNKERKCNKLKRKPVEIFKDGKSLGIFESVTELSNKSEELFGVKLLIGNISGTILGNQKQHKGFTFKYIIN